MRAISWVWTNSLLAGWLLLASCSLTHSSKHNDSAREGQRLIEEAAALTTTVSSHQIAQLADAPGGLPTFKTSQAVLASAFIRQFGDGTVIDKIMVRQAPAVPQQAPVYYLIGVGLHNGNYRAMALPLNTVGTALSLASDAERYVLTATGCSSCFFAFEGSRIVGSTCGDNTGGGSCNFRVLNQNSLFAHR